MPRTYGTTNVAPYASAPAVGQIGDEYYNTTTKQLLLSDGSVWNPVSGQSAPYAPVVGTPPNASAPVTSPPTGLLWVDTSTNPAWSTSVVGPGVPPGGGTGTYLQKRSATDYDTVWAGPSSLLYYQTISAPSAGSTSTVVHNLGTSYIQVQLWDAVTGLLVAAQVQVVNANTISISVTQAMPNAVNVVVVGTTNLVPPVNPADVASKSYVDARTPNLPAPIVSGSGVQSFTDVLGDVWVAANGVNSGAWKRARDVLYCRITRTAAYTLPASPNGVAMPWDGAVAGQDKYGMYNGTGITVPIGGIWMFGSVVELNNTAVNQVLGYYLGASRSSTNQMPGTGFPMRVAHTTAQTTAANAAVNVVFEYTTASLTMTVGTGDRCHMWAQYLGTS